jgi:hypothetical protein
VGPLLSGYEKNLHKEYKTRDAAEEAYAQFLVQQKVFYAPPNIEVHEAPKIVGLMVKAIT